MRRDLFPKDIKKDEKTQSEQPKQRETQNSHVYHRLSLDSRSFRRLLTLAVAIILIAWGVSNLDKIGGFLEKIASVLAPFLIGFGIAYLINVLLRPAEKLWDKLWDKLSKGKANNIADKLRRPVCMVLCTVLLLGVVFAVVFMIVPGLKESIVSFADNVPSYVDKVGGWWDNATEFAARYDVTLPPLEIDAEEVVSRIGKYLSETGSVFLNKTIETTTSILGTVVNILLAFVFALYLLAQKEKIGAVTRRSLFAILSETRAESILRISAMADRTFTNFITGQFAEAVIIGILCFIGMLIFRFPYAGVISVLVGFTALIPIFGAFFGTAVGAFLILLTQPIKAFWFVVFIIVLQQLEDNLIYPRVVGKSVGLPGILVLAAVTAGGNLFGMLGMLLSVPVCAVLYVLYREFIAARLKQKDIPESRIFRDFGDGE